MLDALECSACMNRAQGLHVISDHIAGRNQLRFELVISLYALMPIQGTPSTQAGSYEPSCSCADMIRP